MKALHYITFLLVIIGALNWGLIGVLNFSLFNNKIIEPGSVALKIVNILVGISAIYLMATHPKTCNICGMEGSSK